MQLLSDADIRKRLVACKRLKKRLTNQKLDRTWFFDEKIFTVQALSNSQNDRLHANVTSKSDVSAELLLKGRKHFSESIMVSVAVSKLGKTDLVFVQPGAKINSIYYCDNVLEQGLLPDILFIVYRTTISCFSRTERRHIVHATLLLTCAQMCLSSVNRKTGNRKTARISIWLIMQFGGHCSRWCIVAKFQISTLTS